jgi:hypothetical protein
MSSCDASCDVAATSLARHVLEISELGARADAHAGLPWQSMRAGDEAGDQTASSHV